MNRAIDPVVPPTVSVHDVRQDRLIVTVIAKSLQFRFAALVGLVRFVGDHVLPNSILQPRIKYHQGVLRFLKHCQITVDLISIVTFRCVAILQHKRVTLASFPLAKANREEQRSSVQFDPILQEQKQIFGALGEIRSGIMVHQIFVPIHPFEKRPAYDVRLPEPIPGASTLLEDVRVGSREFRIDKRCVVRETGIEFSVAQPPVARALLHTLAAILSVRNQDLAGVSDPLSEGGVRFRAAIFDLIRFRGCRLVAFVTLVREWFRRRQRGSMFRRGWAGGSDRGRSIILRPLRLCGGFDVCGAIGRRIMSCVPRQTLCGRGRRIFGKIPIVGEQCLTVRRRNRYQSQITNGTVLLYLVQDIGKGLEELQQDHRQTKKIDRQA